MAPLVGASSAAAAGAPAELYEGHVQVDRGQADHPETLQGQVFDDVNENSKLDGDETGIADVAVTNGIEGIVGECGGQAMCATCHVFVRPEFAASLPEISDDEEEMLDCTTAERTDASRLGCQIKMSATLSNIVVDVPSDQV